MHNFQESINIYNSITTLDWTVFFVIILITIASVLYGNKLKTTADTEEENFLDLLLMGRKLTLPMFTATLVATWYGGIFGVTEIAFNNGIYNFVTQGVFWYVSYIIFALLMVNKVNSYKAMTLPDLIEKMFGPKSAKLSAIFNFFNVLPIAYTISLGIFLKILFGGELWVNMAIGITFVLLYSIWGGLRAVVFSDLIQFFVMCIGVFLVLLFSVIDFGGLSFLKSNLPASYFNPTGTVGLATTVVWGFIALSTLVDPNFYQRCFAAKSNSVAKKGILLSTLIWFCFDICTTFGAMYAKAVIPNAASDTAYLTYAIQLLPNGLRGLFLAGILATILSTLDSYLFLAGTTITFDMIPKKISAKVNFHHIGVIFTGILAIILANSFDGNIKKVWKTLGSYSAACLLLPVLYGYIFPGKIKDKQFVFSCLLGVVATTYWRNANHTAFWVNVDELYAGIFATTLGLILSGPLANIRSK